MSPDEDCDCDWWDDEIPPKEEPDCFGCNDHGCGSCEPSRLRVWWWGVKARLPRFGRRRGDVDDAPF